MTRIGGGRSDSHSGSESESPSQSPEGHNTPDADPPPRDSRHPTGRLCRIWSLVRSPFSLGRNRSSSRSQSRSQHRHRHHHHHHHRRRRLRLKHKERNFLAAVCSMTVIVTLSTALAAPNWFYVKGGGCRDKMDNPVHSISVYQFFYTGHFTQEVANGGKGQVMRIEYRYSPNPNDVFVDCVSPKVAQIMRSIISLCFIGVAFSLMAFLLDLAGPANTALKNLRRNAVFNILTVIVCVTINGFSFMITQLLESLQNQTKSHRYSKVEVQFDASFYLVAGAGGMSVIATACNLLRRPPPSESSLYNSEQREHLLEDYDGMDPPVLGPQPDYYAPMNYMPPPPPYSP